MDSLEEIGGTIMDAPLPDLSRILPNEDGWCDAVDKHSDRITYIPPSGDRARDYIHRRFGPISVNPNIRDSVDCLVGTYEFDVDTCSDGEVVNQSRSAQVFVRDLIKAALKEREFVENPELFDRTERRMAAAGESIFVIYGKRGCGKTFFLNYLLARYSAYLDADRVIWVRVNLVEDFGDDPDLMHWIHAQCAKVIMRYYDPDSKVPWDKKPPVEIQVTPAVWKYIDKSEPDPLRNRELREDFRIMQQRFYRKAQEPPLNPKWIPKSIVEHIFTVAQTIGYSFIIVLDGLDLLEATPHYHQKFESLVGQLGKLAANPSSIGLALVAVMRTRSLEALASIGPKAYQPLASTAKQVSAVGFERILNKRIEFLSSHVGKIASQFSDAEEASHEDWSAHLNRFVSYLWEQSGDVKLLEMFGDNRRAQMQVVQLAYFEFLWQEFQRPYLLIESLVKAGRSYPPRHYEYERDEEGKLIRNPGTNMVFDNRFFPSVFTFPYLLYPKSAGLRVEIPHPEGILLGLRIMQLVHAHSVVMQKLPDTEALTLGELQQICRLIFDYSDELVRTLAEEYLEYEFLELKAPDLSPPYSEERLYVCEMPKALYLLKHFISDIAYLNLASMRIPLSKHALERRVPLFEASTLDGLTWRDIKDPGFMPKRLARWVAAKIINSCELIRLLTPVNEEQRNRFRERLETVKPRLQRTVKRAAIGDGYELPGMFDVLNWMRQHILSEVRTVEKNFDYLEQVKESLEVHCKDWLETGRGT